MAASSSRNNDKTQQETWPDHPLLTRKGIDLIKRYNEPRILLGTGQYGAYKDYGSNIWLIGYGSKKLKNKWVRAFDRASRQQIDDQLVEDLKEFSKSIEPYIFTRLNTNRKAAILSFAYSIGLPSFKECKLLQLINELAPKTAIIREWSPYINLIWRSGGEKMIDRRRIELDLYLAGDKQIPTVVKHTCYASHCLLNLAETYNGSPTQIKAIEYLERKITEWDQSGEALRRFFRLWTEKPSGLASPPR